METYSMLDLLWEYPLLVISAWIPLIPFSVGMVRFRSLDRGQAWLTGLMGIALVIQVIALQLSLHRWNNLPLFHLYTPIEFAIFCLIYREWLAGWWNKQVIPILGIAFGLFSLVNSIWIQPFTSHQNTYAILVAGTLLMLLSISFFYRIISEMKLGALEKSPAFWINASILLYYAGSVLILGLDGFRSEEQAHSIWTFHSYFNILHYLLFAIGLWIKSPSKSLVSQS